MAATVTQDGGGLDTGASAGERLRQELGNADRLTKELKEQFALLAARSSGGTPIQSSVVSDYIKENLIYTHQSIQLDVSQACRSTYLVELEIYLVSFCRLSGT